MKYILNIFLFVSFCSLQSCLFDSYSKSINSKYLLSAIDGDENMSLCYITKDNYMIAVVDRTVFAVGYNNNFIIVKQHPKGNKEYTNYFVIPLITNISEFPSDNIYGPMNIDEFEKLKIKLDIKNLDFTIVYKKLEENSFIRQN